MEWEVKGFVGCAIYQYRGMWQPATVDSCGSPHGGLCKPSVPRRPGTPGLSYLSNGHLPVSSDGQEDVALTGVGDDRHPQIRAGRKQVFEKLSPPLQHDVIQMSRRVFKQDSLFPSLNPSTLRPYLVGIGTLDKCHEKFCTLWQCGPWE